MGTLVKFELRKILGNRAGMVACALTLALLVFMTMLNLLTFGMRDYATGEYVTGLEAQGSYRTLEESHAGALTDERVAADAAVLDHANELIDQTPDWHELSSEQVIDKYGLEFWQQTSGVVYQTTYYYEVVGTLNCTNPRATSLQEGAKARLDAVFEAGFANYFPYSAAEREYWTAKADRISWPMTWGAAVGWKNALDYLSFSGLLMVAICIAISGTFAGEYQSGTAAVILPTRQGKRALPQAKAIAAFIFVTVVWWLFVAISVGINIGLCGVEGFSLAFQVIAGFDNPYPFTIAHVALCSYLLGYLIALGMAAGTLLLSSRLRTTMPVAVIPMAFTFLGMMALFVTPLAKVAALTPLSGLNYMFRRALSYSVGPLVIDLPRALALLYALALAVLTPLALRSFRRHQVA